MSFFEPAIAQVLLNEGGLLIDKGEPGGGANFGITLETLRAYRKNQTLTLEDLKVMTKDEAKLIYRSLYWDRIGLDAVTGKLSAILLLDQAVNHGVAGLHSILVDSLNKRSATHFDATTLWAKMIPVINKVPDREFFRRLIGDVQLSYVNIAFLHPDKQKNLRGWLIRTHNLLKMLV